MISWRVLVATALEWLWPATILAALLAFGMRALATAWALRGTGLAWERTAKTPEARARVQIVLVQTRGAPVVVHDGDPLTGPLCRATGRIVILCSAEVPPNCPICRDMSRAVAERTA